MINLFPVRATLSYGNYGSAIWFFEKNRFLTLKNWKNTFFDIFKKFDFLKKTDFWPLKSKKHVFLTFLEKFNFLKILTKILKIYPHWWKWYIKLHRGAVSQSLAFKWTQRLKTVNSTHFCLKNDLPKMLLQCPQTILRHVKILRKPAPTPPPRGR